MKVYAKHGNKYYCLTVSLKWCKANDNGALVSCGLIVGTDLKETQLKYLINRGQAVEVGEEEYEHSACRSSCVKRGGSSCR